MVVRPSGGFNGTIGGGALEWVALEAALGALKAGRGPALRRSLALGPELAQCCGGRVDWRIETFDRRDLAALAPLAAVEAEGAKTLTARLDGEGRVQRRPDLDERPGASLTERLPDPEAWIEPIGDSAGVVYLFGAGHVGRALALALAPLPFAARWIDSRADAFPSRVPANVALFHVPDPAAARASAPDDAQIVVMTHSHAIDLDVTAAALKAERFGFVGLIGSRTKRARFLRQMRDAGLTEAMLEKLVCPIGLAGIDGKDPAVIAASTAAQLLMVSERLAAGGRRTKS